MNEFITIICIIWGILNIILFFKIWKMCDNVARLTNKIAPVENESNGNENISNDATLSIGVTILIMGAVVCLILSLV